MNSSFQQSQTGTFTAARLAFFAACTLLGVSGSRWLPSGKQWLWLAIAGIAVAIWHGAFDGVLAEEVLGQLGSRWKPTFLAAYVALAATVGLLWWRVPTIALLAFLLYSSLHFGTETERQLSPLRVAGGLALGALPIAATCRWWPAEVAAIFSILLHGNTEIAGVTTTVAGHLLWPAVIVGLLASVPFGRRRSFQMSALVAIELLLFRGCAPLPAFAVFFCLWHTPEHLVSTSLDYMGQFRIALLREHLMRGIAPWLVSLAAMAVLCWFGRHSIYSYIGVLFIGLSALTVPHMLLGELNRRHELASSQHFAGSLRLPRVIL